MTFDELMGAGWRDHDSDPAGVAERLERHVGLADDAGKAARFVALALHAAGQHAGDWPRAARLAGAAIADRTPSPPLAPALESLAVALHLAGDAAGALEAELRAAACAPGEAVASMLRVRLLAAEALSGAGRRDESLRVLTAALDLADALPPAAIAPADRTAAKVCNNVASGLLERKERSADEDRMLARAADAARRHWLRAGDWRNDERSDYLLALVANAQGRPADALASAERGLKTIAENGEEKVDEAFLLLARAAAHRRLGDGARAGEAIARAQALAAGFDDDIKEWFGRELEKAR